MVSGNTYNIVPVSIFLQIATSSGMSLNHLRPFNLLRGLAITFQDLTCNSPLIFSLIGSSLDDRLGHEYSPPK